MNLQDQVRSTAEAMAAKLSEISGGSVLIHVTFKSAGKTGRLTASRGDFYAQYGASREWLLARESEMRGAVGPVDALDFDALPKADLEIAYTHWSRQNYGPWRCDRCDRQIEFHENRNLFSGNKHLCPDCFRPQKLEDAK